MVEEGFSNLFFMAFLVSFFLSLFLVLFSVFLMHIKIIFNKRLFKKFFCVRGFSKNKLKPHFILNGVILIIVLCLVSFLLLLFLRKFDLNILFLLLIIYCVFMIFYVKKIDESKILDFNFGIKSGDFFLSMKFKNKFAEKLIYTFPVYLVISGLIFWFILATISFLASKIL
jgi:hypothetical protein